MNNSPTDAGKEAFAILTQFLEEDGWHPSPIEDKLAHRMRFNGKNGQFGMIAHVRGELEQLICYGIAPFNVPEDKRMLIAEFITRANYGLRIGNFEMDFSDGEVRYKTSVDYEGVALQPTLVKNHIYPAAMTLDRYLPGVYAVLHAGKTPEEAIAIVENPSE